MDLLRVAVDFEREGVTRWLADPPQAAGWQYVERVEDAGVFDRGQATALWSEHRAGRAWAREFARTEEVS
ncbi:MAG TPA: hypothetical protein VF506_06435 [Streptosporangiaceae bacterium]